MAAVTMAASSLVALVAAPGLAAPSPSFSTFSSVRIAPLKMNRRLSVVAMAQNETKKGDLKEKISEGIANAQKACEEDPTSAPCAVAWDEVEELTAEAAHQRDRAKSGSDPLEAYCADNPETDECRVYED